MVQINLLPIKVRKTKVAIRLYTYIIIAASMIVLVLIMLLLNLLAQTKRIDSKIIKLKVAEDALADKTSPLMGLAAQEKQIVAIQAMVKDLTKEQPVWIKILDELASQIQKDMWLTKLHSERLQNQTVLQLTLEGEAYHKISVADFLMMLENSAVFTNVSLEALSETVVNQTPQVHFKLTMDYAERLASAENASGPDTAPTPVSVPPKDSKTAAGKKAGQKTEGVREKTE